jgi:hypothetical protein
MVLSIFRWVCSTQPDLEKKILKSNPQWKSSWIPGKMLNMWQTLSSRVHDVQKAQGDESEKVIVSQKVLPGT